LLKHLTQDQTEDYCRRKLSAKELLSVSDHLGMCDACRQQVERTLNSEAIFLTLQSELFAEAPETLPSLVERTHVTSEQIAQYVDGILRREELQWVKDHLTSCERCALAVDELRAFKDQVAPELNRKYHPASSPASTEREWLSWVASLPANLMRSPSLAFGLPATVLLLVVAGWLTWQAGQKRDTKPESAVTRGSPPPITSTSPPSVPSTVPSGAPPVVARLNDGQYQIVLDGEGQLSGVDRLPVGYQRMLKDALTGQRLEKSPLLAGLNRPGSSLMSGDPQGNQFVVTEPVGKVILSDRPTFRWSSLEGATGYIVEVFDEKFKLVVASSRFMDHSWSPLKPLKRGRIYSWQVKALKEGQEFKSPRPPAPEAKFRILDQAEADELAQAQRDYASSHLTLGLLYAQAGLLDDAEQELRALQQRNPESAVVRELVVSVQTMRH
jgi:anti-sigma factor RsiW